MLKDKLKMNDSKKEMMVFTSARVKLPDLSVMVGTDSHHSAATARNLGMILDSHLSMDAHIKRVCVKCPTSSLRHSYPSEMYSRLRHSND